MEIPNYEQIVSKAAKGMDVVKPNWYKQINREELDIVNCTRCIFGQIFGDFLVGIRLFKESLKLPDFEYNKNFHQAFIGRPPQEFWLAEIDSRLEADRAKSADAFIARTTEIINQPKEAEYAEGHSL